MADRHWVGGTGNWDGTTTHWSTTLGGASGASSPTTADNVIFDSGSNPTAYTVTLVTAAASCLDLTVVSQPSTSGIVTITGAQTLNCAGSFTLLSGMAWTVTGAVTFSSTSVGNTITTAGISLAHNVTFSGTNGVWTLQDALTWGISANYILTLTEGKIDFNNKTVTIGLGSFASAGTLTRELVIGTGTFTMKRGSSSNSSPWSVSGTGFTLTLPSPATLSTIVIQGSGTGVKTFAGNGLTYGNLDIQTTGPTAITGANTFSNLTTNWTVARTLSFEGDKTHSFYSFNVKGTSGNLITVTGAGGSGIFTVTKLGGGIVSVDYLSLNHSTAVETQTWYAGAHSTDGGNNTRWLFSDPSTPQAVGGGSLSFSGSMSTNHKTVVGKTLDYLGNNLASALVLLFSDTAPALETGRTTSDGSGDYTIRTAYASSCRVTVIKTGTPNIQGIGDLVTPA